MTLPEQDMLIHKNRGEKERNNQSSGKQFIRSKWYDSWSNLNYGFLFLTVVFFIVAMHDVSKKANVKILSLMIMKSKEKAIVKGKGALWRTIYFYGFLLFSGTMGYINQLPVGKLLGQRTPYKRFTSWRLFFFSMGIFLLNGLWIVNAVHYDLTLTNSSLHYIFKLTCIWLELLWTIEVLLCTRNSIFQYILQAPIVGEYSASLHIPKGCSHLDKFETTPQTAGCCDLCCLALNSNIFSFNSSSFIEFNHTLSPNPKTILHILLSAAKQVAKHHPDNPISYLKDCFVTNPYAHFDRHTAFLVRIIPLIVLFILSSLRVIRKKYWEVFTFFHRVVSILVVCALFHHAKRIALIIRLPVLLYLIDLIMRVFSIVTRSAHIASCRCVGDIVVLDISVRNRFLPRRPFGRLVGAVVYINIPRISYWQFHPISVAFSRNNHLICYVKTVGGPTSWTRELARISNTSHLPTVNLEGPYCMEQNREVAEQGLQAAVSTYDLMNIATPNPGGDYLSSMTATYGQNLLFVAGGVGFAGIASYLLDVLHKLERTVEQERHSVSVTVIVSTAEEEHLMAMRPVLIRCQQAPFISTHYYCTHRRHPENIRTLPSKKDACEVDVEKVGLDCLDCLDSIVDVNDVEDYDVIPLRYTTGRPPLGELLQSIPYQPLSVFCCGPEDMISSLYNVLVDNGRVFSFHNEVYDL